MFYGLYIDDNYDKLVFLSELLENDAKLDTFTDCNLALEATRNNSYDFLVVDIHMPIMDGIEFITKIRQENIIPMGTPLFILSSIQDDETKIKGLSLNIDDYLSFDMSEEEIRLRIVNTLKKSISSTMSFNGIILNQSNYTLEFQNQSITLTPIEFKIFHALFQKNGIIETFEEVTTMIWNDTYVKRQTVNTHLSNLNKKANSVCISIERTPTRGFILKTN